MSEAIWPQDRYGRVLNAALDETELPAQVTEAVEDALTLALDRFGDRLHSLYLSGDAARGVPGGVRLILVLRERASGLSVEAFSSAAAHLLQKGFPGAGPFSIIVHDWQDLFPTDGRYSHARFQLAVNSLCLAGRDLNRLIAPQLIGAGLANALIVDVEQRLRILAQRLKAVSSDSRVRAATASAARTTLRGAYGLVVEAEGVYTECPGVQAALAGLHFTDHLATLDWAKRLVEVPSDSALEGLAFVNRAFAWLSPAINDWLDSCNPERERALRLN